MEVTIKVRFNASKEKFESYGPNKHLIYLPFEEDADSEKVIATILSRKLGTPESRIIFKSKDAMGNWVFQVS